MKDKSKRLYNKPKISKVRLLLEEAVLQSCKTSAGQGAKQNTCITGGATKCAVNLQAS